MPRQWSSLAPHSRTAWNDMMNTAGNPGGAPLVSFQTRLDPQGKLPCPRGSVYTDGNFGNAAENPSCAVQTPLSPRKLCPQLSLQGLVSVWRGQLQGHASVDPQLGLRLEHYGVQHNNNPALDSNFYFGAGNGVEAQVRAARSRLPTRAPSAWILEARAGARLRPASALPTTFSAMATTAFAAATASATSATSAT